MSERVSLVAETSAAAIGSKASFGGGAASFVAFFAGINWIGWLSLGIAILGLLINWYFSWQRNRREEELHALKRKSYEGECNVKD
jgi:formate-dependent nitrite reductase membrane component NrfD